MQTLRSYFEDDVLQRRALDGFFEAWEGTWPLDEQLLRLYDASQTAFDPSSNADEAFGSFEVIYHMLSSPVYGAFRSRTSAPHWEPRQIFDTIKREFAEFSWRGPVNLLNFSNSRTTVVRLRSCLAKMRGIKANKGFPIMTVSKFLHFYNPALFPIYDSAVIWKKVCDGCFKSDFRTFCDRENLPYQRFKNEDTEDFLPAYMRWANSLLCARHANFMQVFVEWLAEQPGVDLRDRKFDPATLYATAFEFTAIGATAAELVAVV